MQVFFFLCGKFMFIEHLTFNSLSRQCILTTSCRRVMQTLSLQCQSRDHAFKVRQRSQKRRWSSGGFAESSPRNLPFNLLPTTTQKKSADTFHSPAMASRSPSREDRRSLSKTPPRSNDSRSPPPAHSRRRYGSRSPSRSPRSRSRSITPPPRRNGRHRSTSRNRSRDRVRGSRSPSESPLAKSTKVCIVWSWVA